MLLVPNAGQRRCRGVCACRSMAMGAVASTVVLVAALAVVVETQQQAPIGFRVRNGEENNPGGGMATPPTGGSSSAGVVPPWLYAALFFVGIVVWKTARSRGMFINRRLHAILMPAVYILMNIVSVAAIVLVNKKVFTHFEFNFPITLVLIHTCVTYIGLRVAVAFGLFEIKALPPRRLATLAASFVGYNAASLVSLNVNTVGFYQISKISVTPTVMGMNYVVYGETTSAVIKGSVGMMLVGVGLATVTDVDLEFVGVLIGVVSVVGAAQQQIMIGHMQRELKATANQLLVAYTPYVAPMLAVIAPLELLLPKNRAVEGDGSVFAAYHDWFENKCSADAVWTILLSACLGLAVSMSTFLLIGATSALTYNIVGHAKTVVILMVGVFVFGDSWNAAKVVGILLALGGVAWYSHIKRSISSGGSSSSSSNGSSGTGARGNLTGKQSPEPAFRGNADLLGSNNRSRAGLTYVV